MSCPIAIVGVASRMVTPRRRRLYLRRPSSIFENSPMVSAVVPIALSPLPICSCQRRIASCDAETTRARVGELLGYAIGEPYFAARRQLGLAIDGTGG